MGAAEQLQQHFTYADYAKWPEDERWELIEGVAYAMAAPSRIHQKYILEISVQIATYLRGKSCEVYPAPFDIRLPNHNEADAEVDTTVQPDLAVICDKNNLDDKGCRGAPDWIIHPTDRWVMVYTLKDDGQYGLPRMFGMDEPTSANLFSDLQIDWAFMQET